MDRDMIKKSMDNIKLDYLSGQTAMYDDKKEKKKLKAVEEINGREQKKDSLNILCSVFSNIPSSFSSQYIPPSLIFNAPSLPSHSFLFPTPPLSHYLFPFLGLTKFSDFFLFHF